MTSQGFPMRTGIGMLGLAFIIGLAAMIGPGCSRQDRSAARATARGAEARSRPFVASVRPDAPGRATRERIYHRADCRWAARIGDANLVGWDSAADAEADGYRPCKVCRPEMQSNRKED